MIAEEEARIKAEEEEAARLLAEEEARLIAEEEARIKAEEEEAARLLAEEEAKREAEWEEIISFSPEENSSSKQFVIGDTPVKPIEEFVEEAQYFGDSYIENESEYIAEDTFTPNAEAEVPKEEEDGEFGGYKLGNVYEKKSTNIKDYDNMKDVPIDILVTKGDPTRL